VVAREGDGEQLPATTKLIGTSVSESGARSKTGREPSRHPLVVRDRVDPAAAFGERRGERARFPSVAPRELREQHRRLRSEQRPWPVREIGAQ